MPYSGEHACRLRDPGSFQAGSFRRVHRVGAAGHGSYDVIMGRLEGQSAMTEQAYRYAKDRWSAADARAHCAAHKGKAFEPAGEG